MSRKLLLATLAGVLSVVVTVSGTPVMAQRVWVGEGGVRVRAPFVRVDVMPGGGVSVRAPFTAIDTAPRGYYYEPDYFPPAYVERRRMDAGYPTPAQFAAMDDEQLNNALIEIFERLHVQLNRFDTGDTWQHYLRLPEELVAPSTPPDERPAAIAKLLDRFRKVNADPQYSMIARLPAFVAMEAALNEALSRPDMERSGPEAAVEDLPLPPPERPTSEQRDGPFLQPRPRQ